MFDDKSENPSDDQRNAPSADAGSKSNGSPHGSKPSSLRGTGSKPSSLRHTPPGSKPSSARGVAETPSSDTAAAQGFVMPSFLRTPNTPDTPNTTSDSVGSTTTMYEHSESSLFGTGVGLEDSPAVTKKDTKNVFDKLKPKFKSEAEDKSEFAGMGVGSFAPPAPKTTNNGIESYQGGGAGVPQAAENENPLGSLLHYRVNQKPQFTKIDILGTTFSLVVAGASLLLYINPTEKFAEKTAPDSLSALILFELSVCTANVGVSYFTSKEAFDSFRKSLPDDLAREISGDIAKGRLKKGMRITAATLLAALSAVPFALATDDAVQIRVIVGLAYLVINYYGLNNLLFTHGKMLYNKVFASKKTRAAQVLEESFSHACNTITSHFLKAGRLPEIPLFNSIHDLDGSQLLHFLAQKARDYEVPPYRELSITQRLFRKWIPFGAGFSFVTVGLAIYLIKALESIQKANIGDDLVNLPITGAISLPVLYTAGNFGGNAFQNMVDAITCQNNRSTAFQLYPAQTAAVVLTTLALVAASFATVGNLVLDDPHFKEGGNLYGARDSFLVLACLAAFVFNYYANVKLGFNLVLEASRRFGSADKKELANFAVAMRGFLDDVKNKMSDDVFVQSLNELTTEEQIALLPMERAEDNVEILLKKAQGPETVDEESGLLSKVSRSTRALFFPAYEQMSPGERTSFALQSPKKKEQELKSKFGGQRNDRYESIPVQDNAQPSKGFFQRFREGLPSINLPHIRFHNPFRQDHGNYEHIEGDVVAPGTGTDPDVPPQSPSIS